MAALIFAGNIRIKNRIKRIPLVYLRSGNSSAMPHRISKIPVMKMISFFIGENFGSIFSIPFENLKCPNAVNSSITNIAIFPLSIICQSPEIILWMARLVVKAANSTIKTIMTRLSSLYKLDQIRFKRQ